MIGYFQQRTPFGGDLSATFRDSRRRRQFISVRTPGFSWRYFSNCLKRMGIWDYFKSFFSISALGLSMMLQEEELDYDKFPIIFIDLLET